MGSGYGGAHFKIAALWDDDAKLKVWVQPGQFRMRLCLKNKDWGPGEFSSVVPLPALQAQVPKFNPCYPPKNKNKDRGRSFLWKPWIQTPVPVWRRALLLKPGFGKEKL